MPHFKLTLAYDGTPYAGADFQDLSANAFVTEIFRLRPGERIREYECIENNEDLQRIERLLKDEGSFRK